MQSIPLRPDLFSYTTTLPNLDGISVDLWLSYNTRDGRWYFSIYNTATPFDSDGGRTPLVGGIPLVVEWPLIRQFRYIEGLPPGDFIATDTSGAHLDPGLDLAGKPDLGTRVTLTYLTVADLLAIPVVP